MREPLLCPIPFAISDEDAEEETYQCVQEKCAWWILDFELMSKEKVGHCAIRDIGRSGLE